MPEQDMHTPTVYHLQGIFDHILQCPDTQVHDYQKEQLHAALMELVQLNTSTEILPILEHKL